MHMDTKESGNPNRFPDSSTFSKNLKFGMDRILSSNEFLHNKNTSDHFVDDRSMWINYQTCQPDSFYWRYNPPATYIADLPPGRITHMNSVQRFTNYITEGKIDDGTVSKRKRTWSRAVFSSLQRRGLEKRFESQKYIMKPDRKQLAFSLGLTDAQVKVWFQNRRMKWRNQNNKNGNSKNDDPKEDQSKDKHK